MSGGNPWLDDEVKLLREMFPKYNGKQLFDMFPTHTSNSISKKAKTLGLKKDNPSIKWNYDMAKQLFEDNGCILLSTEFTRADRELLYICKCTKERRTTLSLFRRTNYQCSECNGTSIYTTESVKELFKSYNCELITKEYKNTDQKLEFKCSCGRNGIKNISNFKLGPHCALCGRKKINDKSRYTIEYVKQYFEERGCVLLSTEYKDNKTNLDYMCECGNCSSINFNSFLKGQRCYECRNKKISLALTGEKNYAWRSDLTEEDRKHRRDEGKLRGWRLGVFGRDKYTCQCCGKNKCDLNAHHLDGYNWCIEKRFEVSNGISLCISCHLLFHKIYGKGNNTREQFEEFKENEMYREVV